MFQNYIEVVVAQYCNLLNATEVFTFKWLILCNVNFPMLNYLKKKY